MSVVTCPGCAAKNRVPQARPGRVRCAKCHTDLPWLVDAEPKRMFSNASILFLEEGILSLYHRELETEDFKIGQWGVPPADFWAYGGGTRVLIRYP